MLQHAMPRTDPLAQRRQTTHSQHHPHAGRSSAFRENRGQFEWEVFIWITHLLGCCRSGVLLTVAW